MTTSQEFSYQAVSGFFKHDEEPEGPSFRAETKPGLGLINRPYATDAEFDPKGEKTQWERFIYFLEHLNLESAGKATYKMFFVARHGQGFHNMKEALVGTAAWEADWALRDGDEEMTWADAKLTDLGKQQAQKVNDFWHQGSTEFKMPFPQSYYASPLARCLETANITYTGLDLPEDRPFKLTIKEGLRERLGVHTCDRRSTKSWIHSAYPDFQFESGFTENDELWKSDVREPEAELSARLRSALHDIFVNDDHYLISLTMHTWAVRGLYTATGHRAVRLATGTIMPLLVKAERVC